MDRERLEALWARFLAGDPLSPEEDAALAEALRTDPAWREEVLADRRTEGLLRGLARAEGGSEEFAQAVLRRLRMERDASRFVGQVRRRIAAGRAGLTRRVWRDRRPAAGLWAAALLVAALGVVLAVVATTRRPAGGGRPAPVASRPDAPAAEETAVERAEDPPRVAVEREPRGEEPRASEGRPPDRTPKPPESVPQATPAPTRPEPALPPPSTPKPAPAPRTESAPPPPAALAVVEKVEGEVSVLGAAGRRGARAEERIFAGEGLETAAGGGLASVRFEDGTRLELGSGTLVEGVREAEGKAFLLGRGILTAFVARQPAGRPMTIRTPHAEATVLGTVLALTVRPGPRGWTAIEVREGRVRFRSLGDGKTVDVPAAHYAVAGPRMETAARRGGVRTASFQDGVSPTRRYEGTRDATIHEGKSSVNDGSSRIVWMDGRTRDDVGDDRYALLRWDVTAIPAGSAIVSAEIEVHVTNATNRLSFPVYELRREWSEAQVSWLQAAAGRPWQVPGARGDQDRGAAAVAAFQPRAAGPYRIALDSELVRSWVDQPAANYGLILADAENDDAVGFESRESPAAERRPRLTVTFFPGGGRVR
ncbi:MAG TPA: DNRLRE domain-containing protein [Planctomycetota bacterium]|nr:DNRLRE domain-containing protein [Planctomycetota bacterium]